MSKPGGTDSNHRALRG